MGTLKLLEKLWKYLLCRKFRIRNVITCALRRKQTTILCTDFSATIKYELTRSRFIVSEDLVFSVLGFYIFLYETGSFPADHYGANGWTEVQVREFIRTAPVVLRNVLILLITSTTDDWMQKRRKSKI